MEWYLIVAIIAVGFVAGFINTLAGAIQSDELIVVANGDQLSVTYEIVDEDDPEITYSYGMNYDFTQNTVTINDFSFFSGFSEETETDFGSGLVTVDYVYTDAEEVTIDFDFYHFEFFRF